MQQQTVFKDDKLQTLYEQNGYSVVPNLLNDEDTKRITLFYEQWQHKIEQDAFEAGFVNHNKAYKNAIYQYVSEIIAKKVEHLLQDYRALTATLVVKKPLPNSEMRVHQDWNLVDETQYASIGVWCPMVDVTAHNGTMYVLKGSHRLGLLRGSSLPHTCKNIMDLPYEDFDCLNMKKGDILFYNHSLIHRSAVNQSNEKRIAALLGMIPNAAQPLHYHGKKTDSKVEIYKVNADFYIDYDFLCTFLISFVSSFGIFLFI